MRGLILSFFFIFQMPDQSPNALALEKRPAISQMQEKEPTL